MTGEGTHNVKLLVPGTACLVGPTHSGKSFFIQKLIDDTENNFNTQGKGKIKKIVYCHNSAEQPHFASLKEKGVIFYKGMPAENIDEIFPKTEQPGILIFDDMMEEMNTESLNLDIMTAQTHHHNLFLIFTQQALHPKGKNAVTVRQNCHYRFIFNFPAEKEAVKRYLRNCETGTALEWLYKWYKMCTTNSDYNRYMLIAAHPSDPNPHVYRTNILRSEHPPRIYIEKRTKVLR